MNDMQKLLLGIGGLLILLALLWPLIDRFGLGRLPGDIIIERENFRFYFPITTMIIVSLVVSAIIMLFRR